MMYFILYLITIIIAYIIMRYLVISKKYGFNDDPQIVSCIISLFWPCFLIIFGISECGDYIDSFIKKKVNG